MVNYYSKNRSSASANGDFLPDYFEFLLKKGVAENKAKWYLNWVSHFRRFLEAGDPEKASAKDIYNFLDSINNKLNIQTWQVNQAETALRILYKDFLKVNWELIPFAADDECTNKVGRPERMRPCYENYNVVLSKAVKKAAQKAGISKKVNCHCLHHSFATYLLKSSCDIRTYLPH